MTEIQEGVAEQALGDAFNDSELDLSQIPDDVQTNPELLASVEAEKLPQFNKDVLKSRLFAKPDLDLDKFNSFVKLSSTVDMMTNKQCHDMYNFFTVMDRVGVSDGVVQSATTGLGAVAVMAGAKANIVNDLLADKLFNRSVASVIGDYASFSSPILVAAGLLAMHLVGSTIGNTSKIVEGIQSQPTAPILQPPKNTIETSEVDGENEITSSNYTS